ncbi:transmembrane protein 106B [Lamellibrachia satsuma]|nr:transmembrane protein 106B [Lamellibrachia satsuma]
MATTPVTERIDEGIENPLAMETTQQNNGYEEFFGGTIPCPSCRGVGRIPRELEHKLVALIPLNDDRLKPSRTKLYVFLAVGICLSIGGLLLFFLYPRTIQLNSDMPNLTPDYLYVNTSQNLLFMTVVNRYNISNQNYVTIDAIKLDVTAILDQQAVASATNATTLSVSLRSTQTHYVAINVTLNSEAQKYIITYCSKSSPTSAHELLMPFHATLTTDYMGHTEQTSLTTYQQVRCNKQEENVSSLVTQCVITGDTVTSPEAALCLFYKGKGSKADPNSLLSGAEKVLSLVVLRRVAEHLYYSMCSRNRMASCVASHAGVPSGNCGSGIKTQQCKSKSQESENVGPFQCFPLKTNHRRRSGW